MKSNSGSRSTTKAPYRGGGRKSPSALLLFILTRKKFQPTIIPNHHSHPVAQTHYSMKPGSYDFEVQVQDESEVGIDQICYGPVSSDILQNRHVEDLKSLDLEFNVGAVLLPCQRFHVRYAQQLARRAS